MRHVPAASKILSALLLLILFTPGADACDPADTASQDIEMWPSMWKAGGGRASSSFLFECEEPPCVPDTTCATYETNTVFVRPESLAASPIYEPPVKGSYCFTIDKWNDTTYYHLHYMWPDTTCLPSITRAGFYYSTSSDGLSWTLGDLAFPGVGAWYSSVICPDVHYGAQEGEMYLYFQGGANGIGRADSYDGGLTFIDHGAPVLTSDDPDSIIVRTPSVARLQDTYYMVYSEVCAGTGPPFMMATLNLAVSMNGFDWTPSPHNPILIAGECDQFDRGAVALGQLVVDPDGETLHLFYSGAGWMMYNGQPSTRGCAKVGHAVSTDLGRTWCKTGSPVLDHPPAGLDAWDTKQYMVTSYTWEHDLDGNDVLRMYYWGEYPAGPSCVGALGIAEATDLPRCPATSVAENADGASNIPYRHRVSLASHPNPTAGRTRIFHGLIPGGEQGAATLTVYNVRGQRIRRLWSGDLGSAPARFEWDGRSDAGLAAASGRYLLRLDSEGSTVGAHWITVLR